MEKQDLNTFIADLINLVNVFPNIPINNIYSDLNNLAKNDDRVQIILKKYLAYDSNDQNEKTLAEDILIIKNVVRNYPVIQISRALNEFKDEKYRVQIVLKKYFEEENKKNKRPLECTLNNDNFDKKQKLDNVPLETIEDYIDVPPNFNVEILKNICENVLTEKEEEKPSSNVKPNDSNAPNYMHNTMVIENVRTLDSEAKYSSDNNSSPSSQTCSTPEFTDGELQLIMDNPMNSFTNSNLHESYSNIIDDDDDDDSSDDNFDVFDLHDSQNLLTDTLESVPSPDTYIPNYTPLKIGNVASNIEDVSADLLNLPSTSNYYRNHVAVVASGSKIEDLLVKPSSSSVSLVNSANEQNYVSNISVLLKSKPSTSFSNIDDLLSHTENLRQQMEQIDQGLKTIYKQNETLTAQNDRMKIEDGRINKPETIVKSDFLATMVTNNLPTILKNTLPAALTLKPAVDSDVILVSVNGVPSESSKQKYWDSTRDINKSSKHIPIDKEQPCSSGNGATSSHQEHPYFFKLMEMFPDVCPNYLRKLCNEKVESDEMFECLISTLLNGQYKRRVRIPSPVPQVDFDEQYKLLLDLFPDADPTYLQHQCERLIDNTEAFKKFVAANLENKTYPSKEDYLRKLKLSAQEKQYTTEFDVKKFLEIIPDPDKYFENPKVTVAHSNFDDCHYALVFLKNHYSFLQIREISQVFKKQKFSVVNAAKILDCFKSSMKCKRKTYPVTSCTNIPLLQEIAYVAHKQDINKYIELQKFEKIQARKQAKEAGLLKTCGCCFDEEIMPNEIVCCEAGHEFCMECVKIGSEVLIGEQKLQFPCLQECKSQFNLHVLQLVLSPKVFSKLIQRKTLEEVKAAGIEELESCPFCDFATIPAPGDKLFRCLNDDCMKESCRLCKEPSHIPLRCDEVEKEKDVQMRTYIEDKMTEALIRKCYKCGMKFVKEDGCNKMTCSCGAMMCYICKQPVKDYKHFNGQGGENYHLCPLYSDTNKLHIESVKRGAETAKKELGLSEDNKKLKIDPAENLERHFKKSIGGQLPIQNNANGRFV